MLLRKITGAVAGGALAMGTLVAMAAPAQAATTTTISFAGECQYAQFPAMKFASDLNVKVDGKNVTVDVVSPFNMEASTPCAGEATVSKPKSDVVAAAKTKSVTKVKLAKNGKKATVTTTVKAGKKNATGKVTITVKKGKKVVAKKTVKVNKGKAKLVVKKGSLKAKGKYVVSAQFKGSKNFKKSNAKKASFKIKK